MNIILLKIIVCTIFTIIFVLGNKKKETNDISNTYKEACKRTINKYNN